MRMPMVRVMILAALISVIAVPVASGATWSIQTTPNPVGASQSNLYGIGCEPSSTSLCMAVGRSVTSGASTVLAERWNGSSWTLSSAVAPSGSTSSALNAVTCSTTTWCMAAGWSLSGGTTSTLVEFWNGTSWTIQKTVNAPEATTTALNGISCANGTSACTAVGYAVTGGVKAAIAERWNGTSWSMQTVPVPAGATSSEFEAVGCRGSTFCMAVGRYVDSGGSRRSLSAMWNGSTWTLKTVPEPLGAQESVLQDVTCTGSVVICTAAGGYYNSSFLQETLIVRWNGTEWVAQTSPNPVGSSASILQGVVCANAESTSCSAVGDWVSSGKNVTLAEQWNGKSWATESTPNPLGATFSALWDVMCRETTELVCLAVGWSTNSSGVDTTLAEIRK
jgi:hypothetical protein